MEIYVKISLISIILVFDHDFIILAYIDFANITTPTATDDFTN